MSDCTTTKKLSVEELLAKAAKPSSDAMRLHTFYRGKVETALKCTVRSFADFAIWYTPGVAAPCKAIAADPEKGSSDRSRSRAGSGPRSRPRTRRPRGA